MLLVLSSRFLYSHKKTKQKRLAAVKMISKKDALAEEKILNQLFWSFKQNTLSVLVIVRPVKRDWAVLSKDTPLDISI